MNRRSFIAGFAAVLSGSALARAIPAEAAPEVLGNHAGVKLSAESLAKLGFAIGPSGKADLSALVLPQDRADMIKLMLPIAGLFPAIPQWDVWWDTCDHAGERAERQMYERLTDWEKLQHGPYKYHPIMYAGSIPTVLTGELEATQVTIRAIPGRVYKCEIMQFLQADHYGRRALDPIRADLSPNLAGPDAPSAVEQVGDKLAQLREALAYVLLEALDVLNVRHGRRR